MSKPIRTFISIPVPESSEIGRLQRKIEFLGDGFRLVRREQLHVTLNFLGETSPEIVPEISQVVRQIVGGVAPFEMTLEGVGVFPHRRRPTVFWIGLENVEILKSIAEELGHRLEEFGFARERRSFSPHLTIARILKKPPTEFFQLLDKYREQSFGAMAVEEIELMQSELSSNGPSYSPLATFPFMKG